MRRQRTTSRGSDRYRNYNAVLKQHETDMRIKKITKVFTYLLLIAIITIVLVIVIRWERRQQIKPQSKSSSFIQSNS
jgi:Zn-dependent M32 family carboxypeptidase